MPTRENRELFRESNAQSVKRSRRRRTLAERFERASRDPNAFDLRMSLAKLKVYSEEIESRLPDQDSPLLRRMVLQVLLEIPKGQRDPRTNYAINMLQQGVGWDSTWQKLADLAERIAVIQKMALDVQQKEAVAISPRQVCRLISKTFEIIRANCEFHTGARIIREIFKRVIGAEPNLNMLGIPDANALPSGSDASPVDMSNEEDESQGDATLLEVASAQPWVGDGLD